MTYRFKTDLKESDVTPEAEFLNRRQVLTGAGVMAGSLIGGGLLGQGAQAASKYSTSDKPNSLKDITTYNNFYEFGTGKEDPSKHSHTLTTSPWTVKIDGLVDNPGDYAIEDILSKMKIQERIYRLRCVEAWSMVIPWNGFQLSDLIKLAGPQSGAKYVSFETLVRPSEMPGQKRALLDWPYVEGLRMDEAMHPLTLMATGLYGKDLPNQNGAPLRLVVPWKYGFKSIKSVVRISLTSKKPAATWNKQNKREYGFYSNVNPNVDHPRWSQASERPIGGGLFAGRIPTLMFNGYEKEVAGMYAGMDLNKNF
ncbi:MAG: sulfoxide reductase catalytic subunit YedY [Paracoccaceae bacterium]|jgi:sulfoxide reductase catalytic subunit YedY